MLKQELQVLLFCVSLPLMPSPVCSNEFLLAIQITLSCLKQSFPITITQGVVHFTVSHESPTHTHTHTPDNLPDQANQCLLPRRPCWLGAVWESHCPQARAAFPGPHTALPISGAGWDLLLLVPWLAILPVRGWAALKTVRMKERPTDKCPASLCSLKKRKKRNTGHNDLQCLCATQLQGTCFSFPRNYTLCSYGKRNTYHLKEKDRRKPKPIAAFLLFL